MPVQRYHLNKRGRSGGFWGGRRRPLNPHPQIFEKIRSTFAENYRLTRSYCQTYHCQALLMASIIAQEMRNVRLWAIGG